MNNGIKAIRLYIVVLFVIILIAGIFFVKRGENNEGMSRQEIPSNDIPHYINKPLPVSFNITKSAFSFPEKIPLIEITKNTITETFAKNVAKKFGFISETRTFNDARLGQVFLWNNDESSLMITPQTGLVQYNLNQTIPTNTTPDDPTLLKEIVTNFLVEKLSFQKEEIYIYDVLYYTRSSGLLEKTLNYKGSDLYRYLVAYKTAQYPINTKSADSSIITVDTLPDGKIYSVETFMFKNISESETKVFLKSYEETKDSIQTASFVGMEGVYKALNEIDISTVDIVNVDKISLMYLYNENKFTQYIQPVFFLEGSIKFKDGSTHLAKLFLDAVKEDVK